MYIPDTQVGMKTTALTLFLNSFFFFRPAAALCDDCSYHSNNLGSLCKSEQFSEVLLT